ncbi:MULTISPECIES: STM3941 family protein [unclassified Sphingobacterium]|uniref:STM3941 family protein n=1 Tax=unclassified Sphingobacterium TaxID=2609468 RepID=UPI00265CC517|nr:MULTISPECIES: STM3941 family protein [unclassified Sphingobacterium]WKK60292.1 STM3941 family protein [Sphingobacterium sp. BN32]
MNEVIIPYSVKKQKNMALLFLLIGIAGLAIGYYVFILNTAGYTMGKVASVFLILLGFGVFLKLFLAPKKATDAAISFSKSGIQGNTTPVAKAAGLIEWSDIADYQIDERYIHVAIKDPEKYAQRMKNFFVRDTFMKGQKGALAISIAEVDATNDEIARYFYQYFNDSL